MIEPGSFDRASGIGGSDVAAILGISPWRTPFDVYLEKTGDPAWSPALLTARMRLGLLLEPALRTAYEQDHPDHMCRPYPKVLWHPNDVSYAHIDGVILTRHEWGNPAEEGIWEGKSARDRAAWTGGVPDYYEAQVRQYLAISGAPWCDLTVLFLNDAGIKHYRIEADPEEDQGIIEIGERFWREHVVPRIPPDVDSSEAAARYLSRINPVQLLDPPMIAPLEIDLLGQALGTTRRIQADLEIARAEAENKIKQAMGDHARIKGSNWSALWKQSKGATKVGWEQVAKSYRGLIESMRKAWAAGGDIAEALEVFTDTDLDAIVGLYTTTGEPTHPFRFTDEREDQ